MSFKVEVVGAEMSTPPKLRGSGKFEIGRGALCAALKQSGSTGGARTSENAGMSSDKTGENPVRRKPKVSPAMFVRRRLGGP